MEISQDQILGGDFDTIERQAVYDDHTLDLCHTAALNAWDRIGEIGKKTESFTKAIQGPQETFTDLLKRLTSAVNRMKPNSEAVPFASYKNPWWRKVKYYYYEGLDRPGDGPNGSLADGEL